MKKSTDGIAELEKLKRISIQKLLDRLSYPQIAQEYGISLSSVNRVMGRKIAKFRIKRVPMPVKVKLVNHPFSTNEDDYGFRSCKALITKQGIVSFDGNSEIIHQPSVFSTVAQEYKQTLNLL